MVKKILLSFDLEEFDIPEEYGEKLSDKVKFKISLEGVKKIIKLLDKLNIKATFFTTANFAIHNKLLVKELSKKHEIASHGFFHSSFSSDDLKKSKKILEKIIKKEVIGLRIPKLEKCKEEDIINSGYLYNSSMNPTFIPGRYNNFFEKRTAHYSNNLFSIPVSVVPLIRFPLFWLSFKNFPFLLIKLLSRITLDVDRYLNIYFHPWEFMDISKFKLPAYIKKDSGEEMLKKLEKYLLWLKTKGNFISFSEFKNELNLVGGK